MRELWSGYALQSSGGATPFLMPRMDGNGHTNVARHPDSALRFCLMPYWASQSLGGIGPGKDVTLLELVATDGKDAATVWSLRDTAAGLALVLIAASDAGPVELQRADIAWAPTAHCVALSFGPDGTALFVDGVRIANGQGTLAVPPNVAGLVFGSDWTGSASAEADAEEVYVLSGT